MIRLIKKLHRTIKRSRHFKTGEARLAEVRPAVEAAVGGPARFRQGKGGGHDFVYFVEANGTCAGVLRVTNPAYIPEGTPLAARLNGPRLRLTPTERVAREWRFCEVGWPHALTPKPLWRSETGDAMFNSHLDGSQLIDFVQQGRLSLWDAIDRVAERANTFHSVIGEAHMDVSLKNTHADKDLNVLTFVDFEIAPNPALSIAETRLFDFLNLVEMAYKGMTPADRRAAPARLERLLASTIPGDLKGLPVTRLAPKLTRILRDPAFRAVLARHVIVT